LISAELKEDCARILKSEIQKFIFSIVNEVKLHSDEGRFQFSRNLMVGNAFKMLYHFCVKIDAIQGNKYLNRTIILDVFLCSQVKVHWYFGGTCYFRLQG
jgi:hypothetical protein